MAKINFQLEKEGFCNVLYDLVHPMLASHDCVKCISYDGCDMFTTDIETLLSNLDIEHPGGELIIQVLASHKQQHRRGIKTLLFMLTRLAKAMLQLQHLGISAATSLSIIQCSITNLIEKVHEIAIPFSPIRMADTSEYASFSNQPNVPTSTQSSHCSDASVRTKNKDQDVSKDQASEHTCNGIEMGGFHHKTEAILSSECVDPVCLQMKDVTKSTDEMFNLDDVDWFFDNLPQPRSQNGDNIQAVKSDQSENESFTKFDPERQRLKSIKKALPLQKDLQFINQSLVLDVSQLEDTHFEDAFKEIDIRNSSMQSGDTSHLWDPSTACYSNHQMKGLSQLGSQDLLLQSREYILNEASCHFIKDDAIIMCSKPRAVGRTFTKSKVGETAEMFLMSHSTKDDSQTALNDSQTALNDSQTALDDSQAALNDSLAALNDSQAALNDSQAALNDSLTNSDTTKSFKRISSLLSHATDKQPPKMDLRPVSKDQFNKRVSNTVKPSPVTHINGLLNSLNICRVKTTMPTTSRHMKPNKNKVDKTISDRNNSQSKGKTELLFGRSNTLTQDNWPDFDEIDLVESKSCLEKTKTVNHSNIISSYGFELAQPSCKIKDANEEHHPCHTNLQLKLPKDSTCLDTCHPDLMELVIHLCQNQMEQMGKACINLNLISCLDVPFKLPPCQGISATNTYIQQGLIITSLSGNLEHFTTDKVMQTLLVNADLTPSYHHKGYKPTLSKTSWISDKSGSRDDSRAWHRNALSAIQMLKVELILVKGQVDDILLDICTEARILVLGNVPYKTLATLAHLCQVDMLTYIQYCSPLSVCALGLQRVSNVWMEPIQSDSSRIQHYFLVSNTQMVQTVVISCSSRVTARLIEERLWKCLCSVAAAVTDGKVLPGAGSTEFWCAGVIQKEAENSLLLGSNVKAVILDALADVFYDYYTKVRVNCSVASGQGSLTVNVLQKKDHSTAQLTTQDIEQLETQLEQLISPATFRVSASSIHSNQQLHQNNLRSTNLNVVSLTRSLEEQFSQSSSTLPFYREKPAHKSLQLSTQNKESLHIDCANFDNYHSKISAWETALAVVSVLVNLDSFIVTGVSEEQAVL